MLGRRMMNEEWKKYKILSEIYDPKNIIVHTDDRFSKPVARIVRKSTLRRIVSEKCDAYKKGMCNACFTDAQELEQPCILACRLTIGKGKKLY
jgi:hypothetical protein